MMLKTAERAATFASECTGTPRRWSRTRQRRARVGSLLRFVILIAATLTFDAASADTGIQGSPTFVTLPWSFEPWEVGSVGVVALLYVVGLLRLWTRAGVGRGVRVAEAASYGCGLLAIVAALMSPLDGLADALFSAHMVEHELLMVVAAPLLVLGRPLAAWVWAVPASWRRAIGGSFRRPGWRRPWLVFAGPPCAWMLHALALWLWHLPALFEAALESEGIHATQHICFLGTALVFWWSVLGGTSRRDRGIALLSIFTTMVHTGALGALFTLSTRVWYPSYLATAPAWGLTALEDQQLGGIIMWVPTATIYIVTGIVLAGRWLREAGVAATPVRPVASAGLRPPL
jgi:putative membrane protein